MKEENRLKLISLNIELDRHLDKVIPFLRKESPDAVCLQEVLERDFKKLQDALSMEGDFVAGCIPNIERVGASFESEGTLVVNEELVKRGPEGIAFFTNLPARASRVDYYAGDGREVPLWSVGQNRMLVSKTVVKEGKEYTIGATHFTWTPDGKASGEQRRDMKQLLQILARFPDIVFCGDFNAPRGGEIWEELAKNYKDNIPAAYHSSIDPKLHKVRNLERMVDGLFSTPEYRVSDVRLVEGVSDHKAIVGMIERM
jgi:endonuclease/exonuclease/phosphatase family metal-dependent hydrolase